MSFVSRAAGRLGGFAASVVLTGLVSLAVVPLLVHFGGALGWASFAVGQTVGSLFGVVTSLGWLQIGPSEVALADSATRVRHYANSLVVRLGILFVTGPLSVMVTLFVVPEPDVASAIASLGSLLLACGATWYFVGTSRPKSLLACDTLPRIAGIVLGCVGTVVTGQLIYAGIGIVLGATIAIVLSSIAIRRMDGQLSVSSFRELCRVSADHVHGLGIGVFSSLYLTAPLVLVSTLVPAYAATYALADRLKQQSMAALTPIGQTLQGWVPRAASSDQLRSRVRRAVQFAAIGALASALGFSLFAPPVSYFLGAAQVSVEYTLAIPLGVALGLNLFTLVLGNSCLVPLGRSAAVSYSSMVGTVAVLVGIAAMSGRLSVVGVGWAVAGAQACVAAVQSHQLCRAMRTL